MLTPPPPLNEKLPTIPPKVEQVLMTALAKDPKDRFGSTRAFANALEQAVQSISPTLLWSQEQKNALAHESASFESKSSFTLVHPSQFSKTNTSPRLAQKPIEQWIVEGNEQYKSGRYADALTMYEQAILLYPHDASAFGKRGDILCHLHRYEQAIASFEQALRLDPENA